MSSRGQGSLEYLLVIAGVMSIAVIAALVGYHVVHVSNSTKSVADDMVECGAAGIQLIGYTHPYDGSINTAPSEIKPCGTCAPISRPSSFSSGFSPPDKSSCTRFESCKLQNKYELDVCFKDGKWGVYLEGKGNGDWMKYSGNGGGGECKHPIFPTNWNTNSKTHDDNCLFGSDDSSIKNRADISQSFPAEFYFSCTPQKKYTLHIYAPKLSQSVSVYYDKTESAATCGSGSGNISCSFTCKGSGWYYFTTSLTAYVCGGTYPSKESGHPPYLCPS